MSLFLDSAGLSDLAFVHLYTISGEDGGLGTTDGPDPGVLLVTYELTPGQPATATRLDTLVNTDFGVPIVITSLNGGNDPYIGDDVTGNAWVYTDNTGASPVIRVVCDVSQCCGAGIATFDTDGNAIATPNAVIVYHELSHAFRAATDSLEDNDEIPATTDENVMRGVLGFCLRDVNNHDGACAAGVTCGGSDGGLGGPPSASCGTPDDDGCFIVTAATGSAQSVEIARLRGLRDQIATASGLAGQLIDEIYREYHQFSPGIAATVGQDALVRGVVLLVVVRPLLAWYTFAATLALRPDDRQHIVDAQEGLRSACQSSIGAARVVPLLQTIRSGGAVPADAPGIFRDLAPGIQQAAAFPLASWAILDPLVRAWTSTLQGLDVRDEVAHWLATVPLARLAPPADAERLERELEALRGFCDFNPPLRPQLGRRLAEVWPSALEALVRHGFIKA